MALAARPNRPTDPTLDPTGASAYAMDVLKRSGKAHTADNLNRAYLAQLQNTSDDDAISGMLDAAANGGRRTPRNGAQAAPVVTGNRVTGQTTGNAPSAATPVAAPPTPGSPTVATPTPNGGTSTIPAPETAPATRPTATPIAPVEDASLYGALPTAGPNAPTAAPTPIIEAPTTPTRIPGPTATPIPAIPLTAEDSAAVSSGNPSGSPLLSPLHKPVGTRGPATSQIQSDPMGSPLGFPLEGDAPQQGPSAPARYIPPQLTGPSTNAPTNPQTQVPDVSRPETQALIQAEAARTGVDPAQISALLQQWQANPAMMQSQLSTMLGEVSNPGVAANPQDPRIAEMPANGQASPTVSPVDLAVGGGVAAARGGLRSAATRLASSGDPAVTPGYNPAPGSQGGAQPSIDQLRSTLSNMPMGPPRPPQGPVSSTRTATMQGSVRPAPTPIAPTTPGHIPTTPPPRPPTPIAPTTADHIPTSPFGTSAAPIAPTGPGHIPRVPYQPYVPPMNANPGPPLAGPQPVSPARAGMEQERLIEALRTGANARSRQHVRDANRKQYGKPQ